MVSDFVDPRSVLGKVQELTETTEVGRETVDGVDVTRFRSVVDLQDETLADSGWLPTDGAPIDAEGVITVDLLVDDGGVLRLMEIGGDLRETVGADGTAGTGTAVFTVSTRFHDLGADIEIEAPARCPRPHRHGDDDRRRGLNPGGSGPPSGRPTSVEEGPVGDDPPGVDQQHGLVAVRPHREPFAQVAIGIGRRSVPGPDAQSGAGGQGAREAEAVAGGVVPYDPALEVDGFVTPG